MRSQQWKATTMNNNIEVMKSVWRRMKRPSAATLQRIKAKAELEARNNRKRNNTACTGNEFSMTRSHGRPNNFFPHPQDYI
jgi:hypothetical protein